MTTFAASASLVSIERKRPPKQVLRLDLTIEGARPDGWILVADTARTGADVSPRGIHTIDRYEVAPGYDVVWLKGDRGVIALRPQSTRVVVRNLAVNRWDDAELVGIASTGPIMVGGRDLDGLFETPVARWPGHEVDAGGLSAGAPIVQRVPAEFDRPFDVVVEDMLTEAVRLG